MGAPSTAADALPPTAARLHLVTGKGGVGKSSVVAAMALAVARRGQRALVIEMGHRASLEGIFGGGTIRYEPRETVPGVFAMNLEGDGAVVDFLAGSSRFRPLARRALASTAFRAFSHAAPGVLEVAALASIAAQVNAKNPMARERTHQEGDGPPPPRWDRVIVDLDATGHALMFLDLPRVLRTLFSGGRGRTYLLKSLESIASLLRNPEMTRLHLVALTSDLVVDETLELYDRLVRDHDLRLGALIINRVPGEPLAGVRRELFDALADRTLPSSVAADIALARRAIEEHEGMRLRVNRLTSRIPLPFMELPALDEAAQEGLTPFAVVGLLANHFMGDPPEADPLKVARGGPA